MRVALDEKKDFRIAVTATRAEYHNLLGYLGTHCDFGLKPESVHAAWEENPMRTLRDVLQFIINDSDNESDRELASGELAIINSGGHLIDFVIQRTVVRHILRIIPGVAKTRQKTVDDCTLDRIVKMMAGSGREVKEAVPV